MNNLEEFKKITEGRKPVINFEFEDVAQQLLQSALNSPSETTLLKFYRKHYTTLSSICEETSKMLEWSLQTHLQLEDDTMRLSQHNDAVSFINNQYNELVNWCIDNGVIHQQYLDDLNDVAPNIPTDQLTQALKASIIDLVNNKTDLEQAEAELARYKAVFTHEVLHHIETNIAGTELKHKIQSLKIDLEVNALAR